MSLKSNKAELASYEEFRQNLSSNIIMHSWSEQSLEDPESNSKVQNSRTVNMQLGKAEQNEDLQLSNEHESTSNIKILHSWTTGDFDNDGGHIINGNGSDEQRTEAQTTSTSQVKLQKRKKLHCCTKCDYTSLYSTGLTRHMRVHIGEKPYSCTQCDFSCSRSWNLKEHMRTHTGEKPYSCTQCDFSFAHSSSLKTHMRTHTGEKPYSCSHCDYSCANSGSLTVYMRKHTGKKPYSCSQCDYSSPYPATLKSHMRTHNGEKPYSC